MLSFVKRHLFLLVITGVGLLVLLFPRQDQAMDEYKVINDTKSRSTNEPNSNENEDKDTSVYVDIKGEVHDPGVYEAEVGMRVQEVIDQAGGFTNTARQSAVNLAQKVQDEMVIIVPDEDDGMSENAVSSSEGKVRINQADQADIETLSGIGPAKAEAIIDYRDEHGPFQAMEDLLEVSGIGEKTIESFESDIQIP